MEDELFRQVYRLLVAFGKRPKGCRYGDSWIVAVYFWAALHDRPVSWACHAENWPSSWRTRDLPSPSTMSDRMRRQSVWDLLEKVQQRYVQSERQSWCKWIDGLPLPVGGSTQDRHARYGHAAGMMAKGYKFHAIVNAGGGVACWRIASLNVNEKKMGKRMLRDLPDSSGYLGADAEYDGNEMYAWAAARGLQLVATKVSGKALGHRWHHPARLRGIELQTRPFGRELLDARYEIDRFFGQWHSCPMGLKPLPAWVRTPHRVRLWIAAKLICFYAWRHRNTRLAA